MELPTIDLGRSKNLTGQKRGKLTYLKPSRKEEYKTYWWVQCECGEIYEIRADRTSTQCSICSRIEQSQKLKGKNMRDLTNQRFTRLIALYPLDERKNKKIIWHCKCDCGNEINIDAQSLTSGNTKSCGCLKKDHANFVNLTTNLVGQVFGYLTVIEKTDQREYGKIIWKCQCDCGKIIYLNTNRLTSGNDTSCGCKKQSLGALKIEKLLQDNQILFIKEYTINYEGIKRFDFGIQENDKIIRLIEYDGEQHFRATGGWNSYDNFIKRKEYDHIKNEYALSHNIPLVRIPYWERDNITLEMIVGDKYLVTSENYQPKKD